MALSQTVRIVENVGGSDEVIERTLPSTQAIIKEDEDALPYEPAIVTDVEIESDGDMNTVSDQCGNAERESETNRGWVVRIQGIITGNEDRLQNLSLAYLRDVVATSDSVFVRTDAISGQFEVSNVVITQTSDLVSIQTQDTNGEEKAFEFQLQLGESQA